MQILEINDCLYQILKILHVKESMKNNSAFISIPELTRLINEMLPGGKVIAIVNKKIVINEQFGGTCALHADLCAIESLYDEPISATYSYLSMAFEFTQSFLTALPYTKKKYFEEALSGDMFKQISMINRDGVLGHSKWPKAIRQKDIIDVYNKTSSTFFQSTHYGAIVSANGESRIFFSVQGGEIVYFDDFAPAQILEKVGLQAHLEKDPKKYLVSNRTVYNKHHLKLKGKKIKINKKIIVPSENGRPPLIILVSSNKYFILGMPNNKNLKLLAQFERGKIPNIRKLNKLKKYGYSLQFTDDGIIHYPKFNDTKIERNEIETKQYFGNYMGDLIFNKMLEKLYGKLKNINKFIKNVDVHLVSHYAKELGRDQFSKIVKNALNENKVISLKVHDYIADRAQLKAISNVENVSEEGHAVSIIAMLTINGKRCYAVSDSAFYKHSYRESSPIKIIFEDDIFKMPLAKISYAKSN